jgi:GT2 family glycosyltransferase
MEETVKHIVYCVVNYFDEDGVARFIQSQLLHQNIAMHIVVVNNGGHRIEVLRALSLQHEQVQVIGDGSNTGYFGAAHVAYQYAQKHIAQSFVFIISNYDLILPRSSAVAEVLEHAHQHQLEVVAPQIVNMPDGNAANPMYHHRPERSFYRRLLAVTSFYPFYLMYQWLHRIKKRWNGTKPLEPVYALHGSWMAFMPRFFERGGTLEYPGFLYGEEIFVAEQCRALNCSVGVAPRVQFEHHEHTSTGTVKNRKHMQFLHQSLQWIYKNYY